MTCGSGAFLVETCRYLADRLLEAWELVEKQYPDAVRITPEGKPSSGNPSELLIPKDPNERLIYARRLIAQQSLYGVDKNMLAVEMAKLSLWLLTLEQNRAFTFLDHAIKCGDSLLGVTRREQVEAFDFEPHPAEEKQISLWKKASKVLFDRALQYRQQLEASPVMTVEDIQQKEELLEQAEQATSLVRLLCDLLTAAAISTATGKSPKKGDAFDEKRAVLWQVLMESYRYDENVESWRDALVSMDSIAQELLNEGKPFAGSARHPFHWPVEFPEVLAERGGFDAIVGNPPFMGGQKITGVLGTDYRNYLVSFLAGGKRGSADLCAYFFLRASDLLANRGGFGLLATNTIAQGDTREVGLDQLVERGAVLTRATSSRKWPGEANLQIAEVWLRRDGWKGEIVLDGDSTPGISSQLVAPGQTVGQPHQLKANAGLSFQGSIVLGMGFVLETEAADALLDKDPRNRDVLFPYLNGEDLNSRWDQSPSRWVINFHDWPLEKAMEYTDCFAIVERLVKPERETNRYSKSARDKWWLYERGRPELYVAIAGFDQVLVCSEVTKHLAFEFVPCGSVYSANLDVFAVDANYYPVLQSAIHESWARLRSSTLETRLKYSPGNAFETFPFPRDLKPLGDISRLYSDSRRAVMRNRKEGLTMTYNRLHDQNNHDQDVKGLRDLHVAMDYTVSASYGWKDLDLGHGFHSTKQGVRFTLAEEARRNVLDRLLKLNHERYAEEDAAGKHERRKKPKKSPKKGTAHIPSLF